MLTPAEVLDANIAVEERRVKMAVGRLLLFAVLAGMFIAGGAAASSVAMHAITNVGVARTVGGCIFPVGLMLIVFLGGELFTGDCLLILGLLEKKYKVWPVLRVLALVWIGNLIGAAMVAGMIVLCGQLGYSNNQLAAFTIKVAYGKVNMSFLSAFISGILCNVFVCCAVLMATAAKSPSGKIWGIFFPILAFVVSGFEHCVANMYYIPAGIFALMNPTYREAAKAFYDFSDEALATINWKTFFVNSSIPVTLGNIVGGMLFVGVLLFVVHKAKTKQK